MFMTPQEVGSLESGDWPGESVAGSRDRMEAKRHPVDWHTSEHAFGGPAKYLAHLTDSINQSEGIVSPIRVRHNPYMPPRLQDGHHRAVVAMETNRLVPVEHHEIRVNRAPVSVQPPLGVKKRVGYAWDK
jgi:hypothetical protein